MRIYPWNLLSRSTFPRGWTLFTVDTSCPSLNFTHKLLNNLIGLLPWNVLSTVMHPERLWFEGPHDLFSCNISGETLCHSHYSWKGLRMSKSQCSVLHIVGCNKCWSLLGLLEGHNHFIIKFGFHFINHDCWTAKSRLDVLQNGHGCGQLILARFFLDPIGHLLRLRCSRMYSQSMQSVWLYTDADVCMGRWLNVHHTELCSHSMCTSF